MQVLLELFQFDIIYYLNYYFRELDFDMLYNITVYYWMQCFLLSSYFKKNCGISLIFIRIIFLYYLSLFELFRLAWLKISRSDNKAHKIQYLWQFSYPLLHANCVITKAVPWQRKNSALASIPKTISIGNVRITNRRYNTRVHCACQESRNYSPADHEKPFSGYKIPSTDEIVFLIDILYKATIPLE